MEVKLTALQMLRAKVKTFAIFFAAPTSHREIAHDKSGKAGTGNRGTCSE